MLQHLVFLAVVGWTTSNPKTKRPVAGATGRVMDSLARSTVSARGGSVVGPAKSCSWEWRM
ncbi:hypothetical protein APY03_6419 [Variovorax sp. WDL1]|nr:hypothetical protein APY03_6419 [Variovorax sp. WDL1]